MGKSKFLGKLFEKAQTLTVSKNNPFKNSIKGLRLFDKFAKRMILDNSHAKVKENDFLTVNPSIRVCE